MCTCVEWQGIVGVYMCGVARDCGCVHVWSGKGLWVCTCVEWQGIVGVYMCGVARDCGCVQGYEASMHKLDNGTDCEVLLS